MHPIASFIANPVKVSVGVLLVALFGVLAMLGMPVQLSPDVEQPTITISTVWPGASPHEVEKEIVKEQEEQLKSVQGVTKMTSSCAESSGTVTLEFSIGTDLQEALLKVNSQLQQVPSYPPDSDEPVIRTTDPDANAIAWMMLGPRPAERDVVKQFGVDHPEINERIEWALRATNDGLRHKRLKDIADEYPAAQVLLPRKIEIAEYLKFTRDNIEAQFERVPGVGSANVFGGREQELQVIVDPKQLAARGLTIGDVRVAMIENNKDISAGDFWEGKRKYIVRTLSEYRSVEQVARQIIASPNGQPVYVGDVAEVKLGYKKRGGFVRGYGIENIAVNCQRETGANVMEVMTGIRAKIKDLNEGILKKEGLVLEQVYDETEYINSAIGLVNQNIILGSALTVIILMLFLHISLRALIFIPLLATTAVLALYVSPWFFLLTLGLILVAGFWFARGALVVALAIPTSIVGTFLVLNLLGRSLNVISLAGLAFAIGMLVDNAVVVLENVVRFSQKGHKPFEAAKLAAIEVWGAVLASTLTTLAVFLPVIFLEGEAGQLFLDIALAISAAVGLSLIVSIVVIPTAAARILQTESTERTSGKIESLFIKFGSLVTNLVVNINAWIQKGTLRRIGVIVMLFATAIGVSYALLPKVEYLPTGNRNLVISLVLSPPGYNVDQLEAMGIEVEKSLESYWDHDELTDEALDAPAIDDLFCVAFGSTLFVGVSSRDETEAGKLIPLVQSKLGGKFPGAYVLAFQTSLFASELSGGRSIEVEITGPELETLVGIGGQIMGQTYQQLPEGTQAQPIPGLDLSSPEVHVLPKAQQVSDLGITSNELGYAVNALVDGAYVTDYYVGADKIDLVIMGKRERTNGETGSEDQFRGSTQDLESQYVATRNMLEPVRLGALADIRIAAGPQQINHRERERAITIQITPPGTMPLQSAIETVNQQIISPIRESGQLGSDYQINLSGTADKLRQTWDALKFNVLLAILITYLLMAALFESWMYPLVIILSVPMGAVGGIIGLKALGIYLGWQGSPPQALDVLTMLGFIILIGTVVNNAILIVHQSLNFMKNESMELHPAILESIRTRIRPIFMTTLTTVCGLSPLVFFPGAGSELYRGLGSVVLGGLLVSTVVTLFLVPTLFSLMVEFQTWSKSLLGITNESDS
ncbi:MAG: HAE1 family hydrophobic/amphiphilic exporter-1 [Mariniblastus sp.]|jgi:HAE1 family hydrophobic/amphiphilic exporter-1